MKKLNDEQMGRIMDILNKGYGDSWNNNYGIFRPMKEWNKLDWLQYAVVTTTFFLGILKISEIVNDIQNHIINKKVHKELMKQREELNEILEKKEDEE